MKKIQKFLVAVLLVCSLFTTGCDASKILEVIGQVAQGIQQAIPAVKGIIDAVGGNNNDTATATQPAAQQPTEAANNNNANVTVVSPQNEDVTQPQSVEELIASSKSVLPYDRVGTVCTLPGAATIKEKYGITLLNGKAWKEQYETGTAANWTAEKIAKLDEILSKMPTNFRKCTPGFSIQGIITDNSDGSEIGGLGGDPIILSERNMTSDIDYRHLVAHEMTHLFQDKNPDMSRLWASTFWKDGKPVKSSITDYGNTNFMEDMAECVGEFFNNPDKLKQHDPERYNFVVNNIWK